MLSQPKAAVHQQAAKLFSYFNNTGGTSKGLMTSILPFKRPTDYQNKSVPAVSFTTLRHYIIKPTFCVMFLLGCKEDKAVKNISKF
jgi:hypothetical protein